MLSLNYTDEQYPNAVYVDEYGIDFPTDVEGEPWAEIAADGDVEMVDAEFPPIPVE